MLADLNTAIRTPLALVQSVYSQDAAPTLDGLEKRVEAAFSGLFSDASALAQLPAITSISTPSTLPPSGSLVRFRAMVQDTGFGSEVYKALGKNGDVLMFGKEEEGGDSDVASDDYSNLKERQAFYVVSVPGETAWVKENLDKTTAESLEASVAALSLSNAEPTAEPTLLANKYPVPSEPHFGCIVKVYGEAADALKTTDVVEFVGVIGETPLSSSFDDLVADSAPPATTPVPALHVILALPAPQPTLVELPTAADELVRLRNELIEYLAGGLGGDVDAAEWLLLALLTRIHTRHPTGMALGSLSLNLALPSSFAATIAPIISSLVPKTTSLNLTIPVLNDIKNRMAPRNRDENLESGALQLSTGTAVLVDMRGIGEGKLEDAGVRNLRHIATTMAQQKLSYEFPYSSFELETDLSFILLSEGKAILPTDCVVYVKPTSGLAVSPPPSAEKLEAFRSFLAKMKASDFTIPPEMSEIIQADFVERRQKSVAGEGMSQEDLLFRMTAARLMALSTGSAALSKQAWLATAELDERRKDAAPPATKTEACKA
ncbi:mini-chromosome maintenance replisome factor-domain-containing protein [Leucosporidium creatinivorum]|uniref:Mini-chromosome maintenance replisome factor-domain-containing protein n=1 Tax=Leucosporidium creatinivorum TaxID=106004 RepID=A0A1Y2DRM3_9BASI|nr:mini-chromosome maintenance replisome factor-domain-containing protein [Leucosporidium creatinivorum]